MNQDPKHYNDQEVSEILRRALERQLKRQSVAGTTRTDLIEAAKEVGVSQADLEAAANELEAEQAGNAALESLENYSKRRKRRNRKAFLMHFSIYALVISFLFALNLLTTGLAIPWFLFPALGWGLGVGIHGAAFALGEEDPERLRARMEREQRSERRRLAREAEQLRRLEAKEALVRGATDFGHAVTQGVGTLLGALANEISNRSNPTQQQNQNQQAVPGLPVIERHRIESAQSAPEEESVEVGAGPNRSRSNR